jgi:hypothetical protein
MKKVLMMILLGALAVLEMGCGSSVKYSYDYDQMIEFRRYRRYNWMPPPSDPSKQNPVQVNSMTDRRIKQAVNVELLKRGMQIVDSQPDLLVAYHLGAPGMSNPNDFGYSYGGGELAVAAAGGGAFILDMIDAKTNELIWRGIASGAYEGGATDPEKIQESVNKIVDDLLKNYPPERK